MREYSENKGWDLDYKESCAEDEGEAFRKGEESVRTNEDNFKVPCPKCGKSVSFSSRDKNWEEMKKALYQAFSGWRHTTCGQAT
ncbi:hypothetical protein MUP77_13025 [Candidatus Bathyarchaeota archaeon]|nr:hypothetical protein [Candidatus Bathyarchaeota archaeon]